MVKCQLFTGSWSLAFLQPPHPRFLFVPLNLCFCLPDFSLHGFFLFCPLRTFYCFCFIAARLELGLAIATFQWLYFWVEGVISGHWRAASPLRVKGMILEFGQTASKSRWKPSSQKAPWPKPVGTYWFCVGGAVRKPGCWLNFTFLKVTIQDFNFKLCKRNIGFMRKKNLMIQSCLLPSYYKMLCRNLYRGQPWAHFVFKSHIPLCFGGMDKVKYTAPTSHL